MYWLNWVSNVWVLETNARKGLPIISVKHATWCGPHRGRAYKKLISVESVEMEDVLKAGHCVEPFRGMQVCAIVAGSKEPSTTRSAAYPVIPIFLFLAGYTLCAGSDDVFTLRADAARHYECPLVFHLFSLALALAP